MAKRNPTRRPKPTPNEQSATSWLERANEALGQRWWLTVLVLATLAVALRGVLAYATWRLPHGFLLNADIEHYHSQALIRAGLAPGTAEAVFGLSPLAMVWGAFWHWLTGSTSPWAVIAPQLLVAGGTTALTAAIGRRVGGPLTGAIGGLLVALYRSLVLFDIAILSESLAVFLGALLLWGCLYAAERPTVRRAIVLGAIMGVGATCRPNHLVLAPIALLIVLWAARPAPWKRQLLLAAVMTVATILPISPVTISNYVRGGVFVPVTWVGGMNVYYGNYHQSQGRLMPAFNLTRAAEGFTYFTKLAEQAEGRKLSLDEISRFWRQQTLREIAYDPRHFLRNLERKAIFSINATENPDSWSQEYLEIIIPLLRLAWVGFGFVFPIGAIGLLVLWRRGPPGTRILHGMVGMSFFTMLAFFVSSRFRGPMVPCFAIGCGVAVTWFAGLLARQRTAPSREDKQSITLRLAGAVLLATALAAASHVRVLEPVIDDLVLYFSREMALEDRHEEAVTLLERVAKRARDTNDPELLRTTLDAMARHRDLIANGPEARRQLQRVLRSQPPPEVTYDYELFLPGVSGKK